MCYFHDQDGLIPLNAWSHRLHSAHPPCTHPIRTLYAMIAKEFIRIRLYAAPPAIDAWLSAAAEIAAKQTARSFQVVALAQEQDERQAPATRWQYGVYMGVRWRPASGRLVMTALLAIESPHVTLVELRCSAAFPLSIYELLDSLCERFAHSDALLLAVPEQAGKGAPLLACNAWLEDELRRLPYPERYHHLYQPWLDRYIMLRGRAPVEPHRSFRSAVRSSLARMGLVRNTSHRRNRHPPANGMDIA